MAYDVRSVSTASGTGTGFTLAIPAGAVDTDSIFVCVIHDDGVSINGPTLGGWSLGTPSAFTVDSTTRVLQTVSLASSGPWTFTLSASSPYVAAAVAITVDSAVPGSQRPVVDTAVSKVVASTTGAFVFDAITPSNTGDVVLYVAGWGRYTTLTPPGGVTQRVEASTGAGSTDKTLWIGSQSNATTAGSPTSAVTVTNDNPGAFTGDEQGMITVAFMSTPPPATWTGDFETNDFSQYAFYQAVAGRIAIQTAHPDQGTKYASFTAQNTDVFPLTPTENPRAQLVSPRVLYPGTERWITWSTRFPAGFPSIPPEDFFVFMQYHGPPYTGSPSVGFGVTNDRINIERNASYNFDTIWSTDMVLDAWFRFALRVNLAQDETGFIELYVNGQQQTFMSGHRRLYMRTVETNQNSGLEIDPTNYRTLGMASTVTLEHDAVRMDTSPPAVIAYGRQIAPPVHALVVDGNVVRAKVA